MKNLLLILLPIISVCTIENFDYSGTEYYKYIR